MKILITGGAGFIGSHVVRLFVTKYPNYAIHNLDKLTYAGNLANLSDVENLPNYKFIKGDIVNAEFINDLFIKEEYKGQYIEMLKNMYSNIKESIDKQLEYFKEGQLLTYEAYKEQIKQLNKCKNNIENLYIRSNSIENYK